MYMMFMRSATGLTVDDIKGVRKSGSRFRLDTSKFGIRLTRSFDSLDEAYSAVCHLSLLYPADEVLLFREALSSGSFEFVEEIAPVIEEEPVSSEDGISVSEEVSEDVAVSDEVVSEEPVSSEDGISVSEEVSEDVAVSDEVVSEEPAESQGEPLVFDEEPVNEKPQLVLSSRVLEDSTLDTSNEDEVIEIDESPTDELNLPKPSDFEGDVETPVGVSDDEVELDDAPAVPELDDVAKAQFESELKSVDRMDDGVDLSESGTSPASPEVDAYKVEVVSEDSVLDDYVKTIEEVKELTGDSSPVESDDVLSAEDDIYNEFDPNTEGGYLAYRAIYGGKNIGDGSWSASPSFDETLAHVWSLEKHAQEVDAELHRIENDMHELTSDLNNTIRELENGVTEVASNFKRLKSSFFERLKFLFFPNKFKLFGDKLSQKGDEK